jgi:hypothetical protein
LGANAAVAQAGAVAVFGLEEKVEHPVPLPSSVLRTLRADKSNQVLFEACPSRAALQQIPPDWFVAANVDLRKGDHSGLVVKSESGCLWGANIGPFWVFRRTTNGYDLVLSESGDSLAILDGFANGYRKIRLTRATGTQVLAVVYEFRGQKYLPQGSNSEHRN